MRFSDDRSVWPLTFWCDEIIKAIDGIFIDKPLVCCENCHSKDDNSRLIMVHPRSGNGSSLPDCGLGLNALVCCNLYDAVRSLPRSWWLGFYGEKHGWSQEDIKKLQDASETKDWLKVQSALGNKYWQLRNPGVHSGRSSTTVRKRTSSNCPGCSSNWDGAVCRNCGYSNL